MAQGWITTARGEQLNLDQLITDSKRPLGLKDAKSEIKKRKIKKNKPLNVRGFKPVAGSATVPDMPEEIRNRLDKPKKVMSAPKVAYRDGGVAETYADLTGVKLKPTEGAVQRRKAQMAKANDEVLEEGDDALNEILEELGETEKPATRTRKKNA